MSVALETETMTDGCVDDGRGSFTRLATTNSVNGTHGTGTELPMTRREYRACRMSKQKVSALLVKVDIA